MKDSTKIIIIAGAGIAAFFVGLQVAKARESTLPPPSTGQMRGVIGERKAYHMPEVGPTMYQVAFQVVDPANGIARASLKTSHYIDLPTASTDIVYANEPYPSASVTQEQATSAQLYTMDREIERYIAQDNPNALLLP